MANLYYLEDHGDCIYNASDGLIYTKVGTAYKSYPDTWEDSNVGNITAYKWSADPQGRRVYTAEEMAACEYVYIWSDQWTAGYPERKTVFSSCPADGVLHYFVATLGYSASGANELYINGIQADSWIGSIGSYGWLAGQLPFRPIANSGSIEHINVSQGDLIEVVFNNRENYIQCGLTPFVYP